jgi:hypothetical protein
MLHSSKLMLQALHEAKNAYDTMFFQKFVLEGKENIRALNSGKLMPETLY